MENKIRKYKQTIKKNTQKKKKTHKQIKTKTKNKAHKK